MGVSIIVIIVLTRFFFRRLLDRYAHWEKQQAQLGGGAEDPTASDLEEVITPAEREVAEKIKFNIEK